MDSSIQEGGVVSPTVSRATLALALALGWLVPGAGHWVLGRRGRAATFLAIIAASFLLGCYLEGELYHALGQPLATLATLSCAATGAIYFLFLFVFDYSSNLQAAGYEYGKAFILTAGLMNVLVILDVLDIGRGEKD